jgi:hypothetical protein
MICFLFVYPDFDLRSSNETHQLSYQLLPTINKQTNSVALSPQANYTD